MGSCQVPLFEFADDPMLVISNAIDLTHSMDDEYKSAVYKLPPLKIYIDTSLSESIDTSYIHTFSGRLRNIILGMV